ncbi:methyltransferase family protein [Occallatibacter savannae]|uniref:methyltransferase family protein n=1 Tax=Occallatibacter savannae TaxID=1002691 RepID=UPI000D685CD5|nr:isoprenylcysteine carboxylmethyltransferase family protein [Occallatibacter savannae]
MRANVVTFVIIIFGAIVLLWRATAFPLTPSRVAGLAIGVPALLLLLTARIQLGRAFSVRAKASNLVTTGLYSRIRNPIYVFSALTILSVIIWSGQFAFLLIFAILIPVQIVRSRKESAVLEAKFGDEYREYKRKTWF